MAQIPEGPSLTRDPAEVRALFFSCQTGRDIADVLEVAYGHLVYILFGSRARYSYTTFEIPKRRGGTRTIEVPASSVHILQSKLNEILQLVYVLKPAANGFIRQRSILTNARRHAGKRYVLNVDLEDFFPSINFGRVWGVFQARPYQLGKEAATYLARICCNGDHLPQGSPASPMVSNLVSARLDGELTQLAKRFKCDYTRYADDITFSTTRSMFPSELADATDGWMGASLRLGQELVAVIESNGFRINVNKQRLQSSGRHQEVTGLTVNEFANVPRRFVRRVRGMIHAWDKFGLDAAEAEFLAKYASRRHPDAEPQSFVRVLKGRLEFIRMVKGEADPVVRNLANRLHRLDERTFPAYAPQHGVDTIVQMVRDQKPPVPSGAAYHGVVTIFFSDIVGSMDMKYKIGDDAYRPRRQEHDRILREEIGKANGNVLKHTGDGLMATFQSPRLALECSAKIQALVSEYGRQLDPPLRIRIGLHAGEPELTDGDAFGIDIDFAARVMGEAEPGEVLCSAAVRGLVATIKSFEFTDRENRSLKGIPIPQTLYVLKV